SSSTVSRAAPAANRSRVLRLAPVAMGHPSSLARAKRTTSSGAPRLAGQGRGEIRLLPWAGVEDLGTGAIAERAEHLAVGRAALPGPEPRSEPRTHRRAGEGHFP